MRWLVMVYSLTAAAPAYAAEKRDPYGLTKTERAEMKLCAALKDYREAVEEADALSERSNERDVRFAKRIVWEEWLDVAEVAQEYRRANLDDLRQTAEELNQMFDETAPKSKPGAAKAAVGQLVKQTLDELDDLQPQIACSKTPQY